MKIVRFVLALFVVPFPCLLSAQTPNSTKTQEPQASSAPLVVDARPSPYRSTTDSSMNMGLRRFDMRDATLLDMITFAYKREAQAIVGGPSWIDFDRFDVVAKIDSLKPPSQNAAPPDPANPPPDLYDQVRPVLKQVLTERFHLAYHNEDRPLPGYVVTVAKGGMKLADAKNPAGPNSCQGAQDKAAPGQYTITCVSETVGQFFSSFGVYPHPVIDRTGLTKSYDFAFKIDVGQLRSREAYVRVFTDAFSKQLGLVVSAGDVPQPAMVVDKADRTPTPNLPDIATLIPALPQLEFEVASIRVSAPDEPQWEVRSTGTTITFTGFTERDLIVKAWQLRTAANVGNQPSWINDVKYTVLVKLPPDIDGRAIYQNQDQMNSMLQKLVIDRLGLKYHWGEQKQDGYVLLAANPKMKVADPNSRSFCKDGPPEGEKDLRTAPDASFDREFHCQNVSMAQFVDYIQPLANSEVKNRVPDRTGLTGAYDFTLYYTTGRMLRTQTAAAADVAKEAGDATPAPVAGLSVEDAFRKELGLRLEKQSLSGPALMVDHIEQTPTEN